MKRGPRWAHRAAEQISMEFLIRLGHLHREKAEARIVEILGGCQDERLWSSAVAAIYTATRGDAKAECWTIRQWLDARDVFNDDICGAERLVAEVCKVLLPGVDEPLSSNAVEPTVATER